MLNFPTWKFIVLPSHHIELEVRVPSCCFLPLTPPSTNWSPSLDRLSPPSQWMVSSLSMDGFLLSTHGWSPPSIHGQSPPSLNTRLHPFFNKQPLTSFLNAQLFPSTAFLDKQPPPSMKTPLGLLPFDRCSPPFLDRWSPPSLNARPPSSVEEQPPPSGDAWPPPSMNGHLPPSTHGLDRRSPSTNASSLNKRPLPWTSSLLPP